MSNVLNANAARTRTALDPYTPEEVEESATYLSREARMRFLVRRMFANARAQLVAAGGVDRENAIAAFEVSIIFQSGQGSGGLLFQTEIPDVYKLTGTAKGPDNRPVMFEMLFPVEAIETITTLAKGQAPKTEASGIIIPH